MTREGFVRDYAMDGQDWTPTIVRKKESVVPHTKPAVSSAVADARKVEAADEGPVILRRLAPASRTEMIQARVALKYNQETLNQRCSFPKHTVKEIEAGLVPAPHN